MRLAGADLAFVNEGNSRGDLDQGPITYAELFRASAYEHQVLRLNLTGAQIRAVLREQFDRPGAEVPLHMAGSPTGARVSGWPASSWAAVARWRTASATWWQPTSCWYGAAGSGP